MRFVRLTGVLLAVVLAATACGDDDDSDAEGTTTARPTPPTIEITARDYSFEGVPEGVPFGSTLALTNGSDSEFHTLILVDMGLDETPLDELAAMDYLPLLREAGRATSLLLSMPGEPSYGRITDGPQGFKPVVDKPGRWIIFCGVWAGADPTELQEAIRNSRFTEGRLQPPAGEEGQTRHYKLGMIAEFTVENP